MNKITAQDVADYLIGYAQSHNIPITPLHLQKYLFYAQGWHFAKCGDRLFAERFQAWKWGPVIPEIYQKYRELGNQNIDAEHKMPNFSFKLKAFLKEYIVDKYFHVGIDSLLRMVHQERAYKEARKDCLPEDKCTNEINEKTIFGSFRAKSHEVKLSETFLADAEYIGREYADLYRRLA